MNITLSLDNPSDYQRFLAIRRLPRYRFTGRQAWFPDEYAGALGLTAPTTNDLAYEPSPFLFDYQRDIAAMAVRKRKFAVFADCGLGKTPIILEFARHAYAATGKGVLIVSPLMVVGQTIRESTRFYGEAPMQVASNKLADWLRDPYGIAITNYDGIHDDLPLGDLGGLILDESSMLKNHYGKWGTGCIRLGQGVPFKLAATGTPAPNDRVEYANHAIFLDQCRTVNEFLASYFVNKGSTGERWEIKPHAVGPFYRDMSTWSIFLSNPATYGWKDNTDTIPPIHVHIERVPLTTEQRHLAQEITGDLIVSKTGGVAKRTALSQLAKGKGAKSHKAAFIAGLVASWPTESTIIWCLYNPEQATMAETFPEAANIDGSTPIHMREALIDAFKSGEKRILISKPKILGFGLNLQVATRQVFSGLQDSYEQFYQAVKRSNRYGSTRPLNVHIPVTEIEEPMIETVLAKASRVDADCREQERIFKQWRV